MKNETKRREKRSEMSEELAVPGFSYSDDGVKRIEQEQEMIFWQKKKRGWRRGGG